ncbi:MAG: 3-isopropylmalate dehydratase large subunit [Ilumatobacteraceae bacterium]
MPRTLQQMIWDDHVIDTYPDGTCLLAVDRQMIYEGTSFQAFEALKISKRPVRRPAATLATPDHMVPTHDRSPQAMRSGSRHLVEALDRNCRDHGIFHIPLEDRRQGIVHVVGPEQGFTLPGLVLVCADSHTSTHGAFGALAFGIGTTELEHVLATQTLTQRPSRSMRVTVDGPLAPGVFAKDLALAMIAEIGASGGNGHAIEFAGSAIDALSMEGRMTLCNMAVEAGSRSGLVAPDETTFAYLDGRPFAPVGTAWDQAVAYWRTLRTEDGATFDAEHRLDGTALGPQVTWGTSPEHTVGVDRAVPDPDDAPDAQTADAWRRALEYMDLRPGTAMADVAVDRVFIGTCTNGRLEDIRAAAAVVRGRRIAPGVHAMVTPGSGLVREAAEREGLDVVLRDAGFEWRLPGCSMCFGGAYDSVGDGQRCASTSNRNFENRQGRGARTHLMSPAMAAAAAVTGRITDVRELG